MTEAITQPRIDKAREKLREAATFAAAKQEFDDVLDRYEAFCKAWAKWEWQSAYGSVHDAECGTGMCGVCYLEAYFDVILTEIEGEP